MKLDRLLKTYSKLSTSRTTCISLDDKRVVRCCNQEKNSVNLYRVRWGNIDYSLPWNCTNDERSYARWATMWIWWCAEEALCAKSRKNRISLKSFVKNRSILHLHFQEDHTGDSIDFPSLEGSKPPRSNRKCRAHRSNEIVRTAAKDV